MGFKMKKTCMDCNSFFLKSLRNYEGICFEWNEKRGPLKPTCFRFEKKIIEEKGKDGK